MKIHIIITFLTLALVSSQDVEVDPIPVPADGGEEILPQKNP